MRKGYKPCPDCDRPMAKHAFRCRACTPLIRRGENHPAWRGDAATATAKRSRAANTPRSGPCESCGAPGTDRHHIDGDPGHNVPENIALLCRRCHADADGRTERMRAYGLASALPPRPCRICATDTQHLRHGRCDACRRYFDRRGTERYIDGVYAVQPRPIDPPKPCVICERLMKPLRRGRCGACNEYLRRNGRERVEVAA